MARNKPKPNFKPHGNKRSGRQGGKSSSSDDFFRLAKRQTSKTHNKGLKGNRGISSGKGNKR